MNHSLGSLLVSAMLFTGCGGSSSHDVDAGPTYCAEKVGPVASCVSNATTGPVVQCGPQLPACTSSQGGSEWSCCSSMIRPDGITVTSCTIFLGGDASCPCEGCGDAG